MDQQRDQRQAELPFGQAYADTKEQQRLERIERLLGTTPKVTTGAKLFDYVEATRIARGER